ncbi:hypothetical protein [Longimicrobium sp.]|uniref:hypothetical protein n=1 Tax=Longimicrobium sp. TaxID=2029185 RepID=UPI002C6040A6|nr:hypothetical protein [Longimicrobium sp.]HSU16864.1 hypothetical protein [Longimicrobium sp.]
MSDTARDPEGRFELRVPAGWQAAPDEDGDGLEVWKEEGSGTLHLISFAPEGEDFPDPAEELYAFLQEQDVVLQEDEVEDVPLPGGAEMALCEYLTEDEDEGESLFWMVGVATAPGTMVFATYFCPAGEEARERDAVRGALASLQIAGMDEGDGEDEGRRGRRGGRRGVD